ncbi:helix-turn-helix domain-containing protein [Actinokineospora sp. G85]|uniref:helix-turn-helix domain-containing protein n=1 Tax=Actinokineospora sp. G85 TaxID=3406626 RepID=UPI003C75E9E5
MSKGLPDDDLLQKLARLIADARVGRGLNQVEAALAAAVSKSAWQNLERGRRLDGRPFRPTEELVTAAATAMEIDLAKALDLREAAVSNKESPKPRRTRGAGRKLANADRRRDLGRIYRDLRPEAQEIVFDVAERLLNLQEKDARTDPEPEEYRGPDTSK